MVRKSKTPNKKGGVIYSRISHEDAVLVRKNILEMEAGLLGIMQNIEAYKELRKREFMWKIKLKKNYKEIRSNIDTILKEVPKTEGVKQIEEEHRERRKKGFTSTNSINIESELMEIQKKLEEMNR